MAVDLCVLFALSFDHLSRPMVPTAPAPVNRFHHGRPRISLSSCPLPFSQTMYINDALKFNRLLLLLLLLLAVHSGTDRSTDGTLL